MIKCALADVRNVPALVLQTDDLFFSGKLLMKDPTKVLPIIAMVNGDEDMVYFIVYDKEVGTDDPLFMEKADQESIDFVKHVKNDKTWVLIMQIIMMSDFDEKEPYTVISLMNIGEAVSIKEPIIKEDWVVSL